jgi:lipopolysaccharide export system permease protein
MAILTVIGRMYRDQEISILASSGMGSGRLIRAMGWALVPIFCLSSVLSLVTLPWTEREAQALIKRDEQNADIRGIRAGRFNEFSAGDVVLYAESTTPDNIMHDIFVQSRQNETTGVVIANLGHLEKNPIGEDFVVLNEGRRYQGIPGHVDYVISEFAEYGVRISGPEPEAAARKREAEPTVALLRSVDTKELAELQKRVAVPLGVLFLSLLAVPLARIAPRRGPYGNIFAAFLIYIVYENVLKISQGMLMSGKIAPGVGPLAVYGLLTLATAGLFLKQRGWAWLRFKLAGGRASC